MTLEETKEQYLHCEVRKVRSADEQFANSDRLAREVNLATNQAASEASYSAVVLATVGLDLDSYPR